MGALLKRQRVILQRYLSRYSPLADVAVAGQSELCGVDLAARAGVAPKGSLRYAATVYAGAELDPRARPAVRPAQGGGVCLTLPHVADDGGAPDDAAARYMVVDVTNGYAPGPLRAHLYDLGPRRGFKLVGIERPDDADPPS